MGLPERARILQHAEQVCYTDGHRYGARMWSGYEGPKEPRARCQCGDRSSAFEQAARKLFGSLKAHCEIYRRTRPNFDQPDSELHQLTLFHDDLPDTYLEFELEEERPVRRHRRPVVEVSITYEPATGVIEVVASVGKLRDQLARIFADTILRQEIAAEQIALRRFDLSRLLQPFDFPFDPADGIESVKLVLLRLHQMNNPKRRLTLECPRRANGTIWDQARDVLTHGDDLARAGYVATKATLSVKFLPGVGNRRGETLNLQHHRAQRLRPEEPDGTAASGRRAVREVLGSAGRGVMVATTLVSREAIELVFRLCEQQPAEISWHVLNMHFNRLGEELISAGALVETTPSETIVMPMDLDDELVGFEWEADRQAFVGFHPNMGLVEADPRVRKRYRVNFDWLLSAIAGAAGVAAGQRRVCLVDDLLWDLGDARLRRQQTADAVRTPPRLSRMPWILRSGALIARQGRADGVLLTTSPRISRAVRLPGRHRILHIRDCLDHASRHFALDADVIAGSRLTA